MGQIIIPCDSSEVSDTYHTFSELYAHRSLLLIALMLSHPETSWRSLKHDDGTAIENYFIAGMDLPADFPFDDSGNGHESITYHLEMRYWVLLEGITTHVVAPEWDRHSSNDVLDRLRIWIEDGLTAVKEHCCPPVEINIFDEEVKKWQAYQAITNSRDADLEKLRQLVNQEQEEMLAPHKAACKKQLEEENRLKAEAERRLVAEVRLNQVLTEIKNDTELCDLFQERGLLSIEALSNLLSRAEDFPEDYRYE